MGKAIIGLFDDINSARSAKIILEGLGVDIDNSEIILKEEYQEKLHRLTTYGFSSDDIESINNGFKDGDAILSVRNTSKYKEVFQSLIDNKAKTVFTSTEYISNEDNDMILLEDNKTIEEKDNQIVNDLSEIDNKENSITEDDLRIYLHEEDLDISKEKIQSGEIIIRKEIIEEIKTIHIPIIREEVVIEKITSNDNKENEEKREEIKRIVVMEEDIEIIKSAIIGDKLDIKKIQVQDKAQITETLKKEELEVSNIRKSN